MQKARGSRGRTRNRPRPKAVPVVKRSARGRNSAAIHFRGPKNNPVPIQMWTKVIASGSFYTAAGTGTGDYNFNVKLNSVYLPFVNVSTGVTWNGLNPATYVPRGHTTLCKSTYYSLFLVYKSKMEIDVLPQSVTDGCVGVLTASTQTGNPSSIGTAMDRPYTKQMRFSSGRTPQLGDYPLRYTVFIPQMLGIRSQVYENDTSGVYVGAYNSDPSILLNWVFNLETGDNAVLGFDLEVSFRVTYWVKYYGLQPELLALSSPSLSPEEGIWIQESLDALEYGGTTRYHYGPNGRMPLGASGCPLAKDVREAKEEDRKKPVCFLPQHLSRSGYKKLLKASLFSGSLDAVLEEHARPISGVPFQEEFETVEAEELRRHLETLAVTEAVLSEDGKTTCLI